MTDVGTAPALVADPPVPYYTDEFVTLYKGDCREVLAWLNADVMVTDPPYGIGWSISQNNVAKSAAHDGIQNDSDTSCRDRALELWGDRPAAVFGTWAAPFPVHRRQVLVWRKPVDAGVVGSTTGYRRDTELIFLLGSWPLRPCTRSSVIETGGGKNRYLTGHPHAKPLHVVEELLTPLVGSVADPFAGSGTTLLAAKRLGRTAIGVEIEERYCEIAARRLSQEVLAFEGAS